MKRFNKSIIIGSLLVAALGSGCKKSFFDINKDPNNAVESNISPDLVAPQALLNAANRVGTGYGFLCNWVGYWAPGANYAPNTEEQAYGITTNFGAGLFGGLLDNAYDFQFMEEKAAASKQTFYQGIAKIMKSNNFAQLVDLYNNVPYSEALQGLKSIRPKYDDAKGIYEDLIKQIDTGIVLIKGAVASENLNLSEADIMFGGDKTEWVQFANTLKLRLLMHQSNRADRQAYIQAEVAKIVAEGSGFLPSGVDASVAPAYQTDKPNAFYASFGFTAVGTQATDFWRANVVAMNYLKANGPDPRLGFFYKPIVSAPGNANEPFTQPAPLTHRGNQYGLPINNITYPWQTANYVSQVGGISTAGAQSASAAGLVKGYNQRMWVLTSVESKFLQAEAILKGYLAGDAKTAYMDAVKESFRWLNVGGSRTAADNSFNTWYNTQVTNDNKDVNWDGNTTAVARTRTLMFQKYLAMLGTNPLETWTDYRRYTGGTAQTDPDPVNYAPGKTGTGSYPYLDLSQNPGRTATFLPVRLLYPQRELDLNTDNVPSVGIKSGDQFTAKIWWMP